MAYPFRLAKTLLWVLGGLILFRGIAYSVDVSVSPYGRVVKLPIEDRHDIRFVPVSADEGVLQSGIGSIAQDNYGFLWLAGRGLHRYDGYGFESLRHEPGNPNGLSDDSILDVLKDRAGILWVGTAFGGLDRLDPASGAVTHYHHDPGNERSISNNSVACLYQDRSGHLWIGTNGGLDRLDPATGTFTHYRHNSQDAFSLSSNDVTSLFEDRRGTLWVGTASGLNKLDRATSRFSRFLPDPAEPQSIGHNYVNCIREDHAGVLWVAIGNWLSSVNPNSGAFTHYPFHSVQPGSQSVAFATSIHEDRDGMLWLSTVDTGVLKLDRERTRFTRYTRDPGNPNSLPDNFVRTLFEDGEGTLWAGTGSGLSRFRSKPPAFVNYQHEAVNPQSLPDNPIWSVLADSKGFLWIAGAGGLNRLDRRTGQRTVYQHDPKDRQSVSNNTVSAIREDHSGTLWFGTYGGGLNRFDRATRRFIAYRHEPKLPGTLSSDLVLSLLEDRLGTLWVGTQAGGLNRLDPVTGRFTSWRNDPANPRTLSHDNVITIFEDRAGVLWLGTLNGLNRFDPGTQQFVVYRHHPEDPRSLSHGKVNAIWEDRRGTLWIGTDNGLNQLDPRRGSFTSFTKANGLPDNKITAILEDDQGYLWLGTQNGLSRFHPQTGIIRNYSESDGLPGNSLRMGHRTSSGELMFASTNGLITFHPEQVSTNTYVPPVVLTGFSLFNRPVHPGAQSPLRKSIWATNSLTLTRNQNIFTFEFAALSYLAPGKNRYRYRLEGLEPEWNEVDSRRRLATYTSLPSGTYTFRVQASNNDGLWNETGATLVVTVLPPWWATWWFSGMAGLSLAGVAFGAYRTRVRSLHLAAARLEIQVSERTGELLNQTRELQIAKDAAEAANRAKTTFLANMSHELRTPLNAILGFSNLLREEDVSEKQRGDLDVINRSGEHLLNLINDVLDVAKIEAGNKGLELMPCDLTGLVVDVMDMMRERAEARKIALFVLQPTEFPRYVRVDAPKLRQVLINLLDNAVKYTDAGSVGLQLEAGPTDASGRIPITLSVEDTGIGVSREDQARIFEAFVQIGKPDSQRGTGLGLTITRQFVELMGGTIRVESTPGEGSRFCVQLSVEQAQESELVGRAAHSDRVIGVADGEPAYRILVIDDDRHNRALLERLLQNAGFHVRVAIDGEQGVELFRLWRPHFIWMDLRMPVLDGVQATRHIRALAGGQDVKIAAVTASVFAGQRSEILAAGIDDLVCKPYRPADVFDCMARHLGVRYRFREVQRASSPELSPPLRAEALAALPADLRAELRDAVVALHGERIAGTIGRVLERDPDLGVALAHRANRLEYTAIFEAIESCRPKARARPA